MNTHHHALLLGACRGPTGNEQLWKDLQSLTLPSPLLALLGETDWAQEASVGPWGDLKWVSAGQGRVWILTPEQCTDAGGTLRRVTMVAGEKGMNEDRWRLSGRFRCLWRASWGQALGLMTNDREGGQRPSLFSLPSGSGKSLLAGGGGAGETGSGGWGAPGARQGWSGLLMHPAANCPANSTPPPTTLGAGSVSSRVSLG